MRNNRIKLCFLLIMRDLFLTAKADYSFLKFNPRLKPGAKNPLFSWASAINFLFCRTLMIKIINMAIIIAGKSICYKMSTNYFLIEFLLNQRA